MSDAFNLIDEGWIPCVLTGEAPEAERRREVGLRDVFLQAADIQEISDPSPLITVALHRMLLAIAHRMLDGPRDMDHWADVWEKKAWDPSIIASYLERPDIHTRFNLFDATNPFYQVTNIGSDYAKPITMLTHELISSSNPVTLFDHTTPAHTPAFSPGQAARYLIAFQSYAVGGLVSLEKDQDPKIYKSAPAAPLVKGAVALARGANLFETILLNLVRYNVEVNAPFRGQRRDDRPSWEQDRETSVEERRPDGYLDYLTWQSRRIRLFPSRDHQNQLVVRDVAIMKGFVLPPDERYRCETMVAFRTVDKGPDPHPAVGFRADRALWRDSLSIVQSTDAGPNRPESLDWLSRLRVQKKLTRDSVPLDLLGMVTDQARVLLWRHERLPLPLVYVAAESGNLRNALEQALRFAENIGSALNGASYHLARLLLSPNSDQKNAHAPAKEDTSKLAASFAMGHAYWPQLEMRFKSLLEELPQDSEEQQGVVSYGDTELPLWAQDVVRAGRRSFEGVTAGLDGSARSLKATAVARSKLEGAIATIQRESGVASRQQEGDAA